MEALGSKQSWAASLLLRFSCHEQAVEIRLPHLTPPNHKNCYATMTLQMCHGVCADFGVTTAFFWGGRSPPPSLKAPLMEARQA